VNQAKKYLVGLFLLSGLLNGKIQDREFDFLMQKHLYGWVFENDQTYRRLQISASDTYNFFKDLYDQIIQLTPDQQYRIPTIIHQIWLGSPVPEELKKFQESWHQFHPTWQYRLWTDKDIVTFGFENLMYIRKSTSYAERSDMMRYEILYRYGGVYVDMDQECLRSFDILHQIFDFYIGIQPLDTGVIHCGTGVIGSIAGHPLLRAVIDGMAASWQRWTDKQAICERTGPLFFTQIFMATIHQEEYRTVALPTYYFYPLGSQEYECKRDQWKENGAFAVHHWAKTWLKPQFRRPEFRSIKNYR
jgi:mannosyltransferase OCH1-like enzyme